MDWASSAWPMAMLQYDTYTEEDYNTIFDNYTYSGSSEGWPGLDFGKRNCSIAEPRHASSKAKPTHLTVSEVT